MGGISEFPPPDVYSVNNFIDKHGKGQEKAERGLLDMFFCMYCI